MVILASSILSLEMVVAQLPVTRLRRSTLFVDVCSVKEFPKRLMLSLLPPEVTLFFAIVRAALPCYLCCHISARWVANGLVAILKRLAASLLSMSACTACCLL